MHLIQVVLMAFVCVTAYVYLTKLRSLLADRLLVITAVTGSALLLAAPDVSIIVAGWFGVGRGVDLLFYLAHSATALLVVILYSKLRAQSQEIVRLTRQIALHHARSCPAKNEQEGERQAA